MTTLTEPDSAAPPRSLRECYASWLEDEVERDARTVCLDSDTGLFSGRERLRASGRYLNLGIAEQNLFGMAAGMASEGFRPYVNTMAAFASLRAGEMAKLDIAYPGLPVRVVATHAGLSAGHLGPTHHALEDVAVMRLLPNFTVVAPADYAEVEALLEQIRDLPGPCYLRLDRKAASLIPANGGACELGRAKALRAGGDLTLVACGSVPVRVALAAADRLAAEHGVEAAVLNMHTVKPLDTASLDQAAARGPIAVLEDHHTSGGLGGAVAEHVAQEHGGTVARLGASGGYQSVCMDHADLLARAGLDAAAVVTACRRLLEAPDSRGARPETTGDLVLTLDGRDPAAARPRSERNGA